MTTPCSNPTCWSHDGPTSALETSRRPRLLAVEVLSPSTRRVDLTLKRSRFEAAGCPSYWVVDPDEPSLTVWQLQQGTYVEVAHAVGTERADVDAPYPLTVCPADLID